MHSKIYFICIAVAFTVFIDVEGHRYGHKYGRYHGKNHHGGQHIRPVVRPVPPVNICPPLICPLVHIPSNCRKETYSNVYGVLCRGCDENICDNKKTDIKPIPKKTDQVGPARGDIPKVPKSSTLDPKPVFIPNTQSQTNNGIQWQNNIPVWQNNMPVNGQWQNNVPSNLQWQDSTPINVQSQNNIQWPNVPVINQWESMNQWQNTLPMNANQWQNQVPVNTQLQNGNQNFVFPNNNQLQNANGQIMFPNNNQLQNGNGQIMFPNNNQLQNGNGQIMFPNNNQLQNGNGQIMFPNNNQLQNGNGQNMFPNNNQLQGLPVISVLGNIQNAGVPSGQWGSGSFQGPVSNGQWQGAQNTNVPTNAQVPQEFSMPVFKNDPSVGTPITGLPFQIAGKSNESPPVRVESDQNLGFTNSLYSELPLLKDNSNDINSIVYKKNSPASFDGIIPVGV